jgi:mannose-6-phosphate isomerase-like protein (cupin superfamily)
MTRALTLGFAFLLVAAVAAQAPGRKGGYIIQHDRDVARTEPGPHDGPGQTVGHVFFDKTPNLHFSFRKRVLRPGSGIGEHEQHEDEVYYVLSGRGVMTLDGKPYEVTPGTAVLTRTGSSHGLRQVGSEDLVVIITYETR